MLAASAACSQVSPDHLQAAPLLVLRAIGSHWLGATLALPGLKSEPRIFAQDNTPRNQCCRHPAAVGPQQLYLAAMPDSNTPTSLIPFGDKDQFLTVHDQPHQRSKRAPNRRHRQRQNRRQADNGRSNSEQDDNPPQERIRTEFGRVCVRRHARVRLQVAPSATSSSRDRDPEAPKARETPVYPSLVRPRNDSRDSPATIRRVRAFLVCIATLTWS